VTKQYVSRLTTPIIIMPTQNQLDRARTIMSLPHTNYSFVSVSRF